MMRGEMDKLRALKAAHPGCGPRQAVSAVAAKPITKSRAGTGRLARPLGSFFFLGPTGVSKTELLKRRWPEILFDDERSLVRIDMSSTWKFSVQRLISAPPGYVGYDRGWPAAEAVRRHPYSVVLLDEMEKVRGCIQCAFAGA